MTPKNWGGGHVIVAIALWTDTAIKCLMFHAGNSIGLDDGIAIPLVDPYDPKNWGFHIPRASFYS